MQENISFQTRDGQIMNGMLFIADVPRGSAVFIHGLGGYKEQEHLVITATTLAEKGFSTLIVDAIDDIAHGKEAIKRATPTRRIENLEDAVRFAHSAPWFKAPFLIGGHSLGGIAAGTVAASGAFPIDGVVLLAPVVSGDIQWAGRGADVLRIWKERTYIDREFVTRPGELFQLHYNLVGEARKYSLLRDADKLTMPVLMVVGSDDDSTPAEHLKLLDLALDGRGTYVEIPETRHNFRGKESDVACAVGEWIETRFPSTL